MLWHKFFRRSMFHAPRCRRRSFSPRLFLSLYILQSLPGPMARESKSPLVMERALPQARSVAANFTGRKLYYQSYCYARKARRSSVGDEVHCRSQCWRHEICSLYRRTKTKGKEEVSPKLCNSAFCCKLSFSFLIILNLISSEILKVRDDER